LNSEVENISRMCDLTRARLEKRGRFPKRVRIGGRRVAWRKAEIEAWIADPEGWALSTGPAAEHGPNIEPKARVVL
jgi:predicted DNA-binding transcriptional regulator AlpA